MMKQRKHYLMFLAAALTMGGCKTDNSPSRMTGEAVEVEKNEPRGSDELAAAEPAAARPEKTSPDEEPSYEVREYERTPWSEEYLDVKLFWDAEQAMLSPCAAPSGSARCKRKGPTLKKGDELSWKNSRIRVTPRIMTAKKEVDLSLSKESLALKPGEELAFYVYHGEGMCAVAVDDIYAEGVACPTDDAFDNFPEVKGGTAQTLQPADVEWWIEMDDGWVQIDTDRVRVEFGKIEL